MLARSVSKAFAVATLAISSLVFADNQTNYVDALPNLTTTSNPFAPEFANAPGNPEYRNGVGSIFIQFAGIPLGGFICTASAISPTHILTAGHCLRNLNPDGSPDTVTNVLFVLPSIGAIIPTTGFSVNPLFDALSPDFGAFAPGDVAVIELAVPLPEGVEIYELYRDSDELGAETQHYGHGRSGTGDEGDTVGSDFFYARTGKNQYDATFEPFFGPFFQQVIHDFDNGKAKNDAMPWYYSPAFLCPASTEKENGKATKCNVARGLASEYRDKGFGELEVGIAPGDSGGPGFVDGKIAGVHSFGFTHRCDALTGNVPDVTCGLDSSYGEMAGDARVSAHAAWIDFQVSNGVSTPIPEPVPAIAAGSGQSGAAATTDLPAAGRYLMSQSVARHMRLKVEAAPEE
jgi:hypothetical protein